MRYIGDWQQAIDDTSTRCDVTSQRSNTSTTEQHSMVRGLYSLTPLSKSDPAAAAVVRGSLDYQ